MGAGGEPNAGFLPASKRITDAPWLRVALGRYEKGRTRFDVLSAHDVLAAALDPVKPVGSHDVGAAAARHRVAVAVANENLVAARPADDDVPTRPADEHLGARAAEKAVAAASAVEPALLRAVGIELIRQARRRGGCFRRAVSGDLCGRRRGACLR
jgi:hypothetical protein